MLAKAGVIKVGDRFSVKVKNRKTLLVYRVESIFSIANDVMEMMIVEELSKAKQVLTKLSK